MIGPGFRFAARYNQQALTVVNGREALRIEHRVEKPTYFFALQGFVGMYSYSALHPRIKDNGLAQDGAHLTNNIANVGVVHCQLPGRLISF
ncbi:hypothetical protein D3C78_931640 [compost metagenome]